MTPPFGLRLSGSGKVLIIKADGSIIGNGNKSALFVKISPGTEFSKSLRLVDGVVRCPVYLEAIFPSRGC